MRLDWTGRAPRCCRVCERCGWREFSDPAAVCPEHGQGTTEFNRPYMGGPVAQHVSFDEKAWDRVLAARSKKAA